jgi:hypothetical protein
LSSSGERSESSGTLPRAELNPLLNPLLAENMGRWAEVYFTSPPEKREEAILDLLRELEAAGPSHASAPSIEANPIQASHIFARVEAIRREPELPIRRAIVACTRCGTDNPVTHQFCGMCGAALNGASAEENRADSPYAQHTGEMESVAHFTAPERRHQTVTEPYSEDFHQRDEDARQDPYDLSLLQGLRSREIGDYEYEEPSSPPYRYYIGAVLAILLVLLGYMAYRSGQLAQGSHPASAPPPTAAESIPAATSPAPQTNSAASPNEPKTATPPLNSSNNGAETARPQTPEPRANQANRSQNAALATNAPPAAASTAESQFSETSGADDLAMAQRYLNGGRGQARDPVEAAKWLWKAMGKHNGPATLMLADLYLKGDGVAKNCDQARVLLDSAAIRGMKGAGERLRNLQAFGCQ